MLDWLERDEWEAFAWPRETADDPDDVQMVRASHIQFPAGHDAEARAVRGQIERGEISFADAARRWSADPFNQASGGDLGWFARGYMVDPFEEAAFEAEVGRVVGPVETVFGLHLVLVTGRSPRASDASRVARAESDSSIVPLVFDRSGDASETIYAIGEPVAYRFSRGETDVVLSRVGSTLLDLRPVTRTVRIAEDWRPRPVTTYATSDRTATVEIAPLRVVESERREGCLVGRARLTVRRFGETATEDAVMRTCPVDP